MILLPRKNKKNSIAESGEAIEEFLVQFIEQLAALIVMSEKPVIRCVTEEKTLYYDKYNDVLQTVVNAFPHATGCEYGVDYTINLYKNPNTHLFVTDREIAEHEESKKTKRPLMPLSP